MKGEYYTKLFDCFNDYLEKKEPFCQDKRMVHLRLFAMTKFNDLDYDMLTSPIIYIFSRINPQWLFSDSKPEEMARL